MKITSLRAAPAEFRTTFGESHGKAIGGVLDGMPSNLKIDTAEHDPKIKEEVFEESGMLESDIQVFITEKDETNATKEHDSETNEELIKEYGKLNKIKSSLSSSSLF